MDKIFNGDCIKIMKQFEPDTVSACITDPPYNYEFIGKNWDTEEVERRISRSKKSNTLVKNIPYGSGLAGGVRNKRWYDKNRSNILDYEEWCLKWSEELYRILKPGSPVAVFNSTRTLAHVQVALEKAGFYARDILVYRRSSGIPKGYNAASQLKRKGYQEHYRWQGWHSCFRNEWEGIVLVQKPLEQNYSQTLMKYGVGVFNTTLKNGGFQSNILENIQRDKKEEFNVHCTVKPLSLMEKLVSILVPEGTQNVVIDPFAGSGTTLLAAKHLGRGYLGIEIEKKYVEIIRERLNYSLF